MHDRIDTSNITCFQIFTYTYEEHKKHFYKKHFFVRLTLFSDLKNKLIQTKIIPFFESIFKVKVMLGGTLSLILLTLAVKI